MARKKRASKKRVSKKRTTTKATVKKVEAKPDLPKPLAEPLAKATEADVAHIEDEGVELDINLLVAPGDIIFATGRFWRVDKVMLDEHRVAATATYYVESQVDGDMSLPISFNRIETTYKRLGN